MGLRSITVQRYCAIHGAGVEVVRFGQLWFCAQCVADYLVASGLDPVKMRRFEKMTKDSTVACSYCGQQRVADNKPCGVCGK